MLKKKTTDMTIGDCLKFITILTGISWIPVLIMFGWEHIKDGFKKLSGKIARKEGDH